MKIMVTSVMVDDQEKALKLYTEVLGFKMKTDIHAQCAPFRPGRIRGYLRQSDPAGAAMRKGVRLNSGLAPDRV